MGPREIATKYPRVLDSRARVLLYLAEGPATFAELEGLLKRRTLYWALRELSREGVIEEVEGRYRLLGVKAVAKTPSVAAKARGVREQSPCQALAEAHPHVRGLVLQAGRRLPKVAQPMAARAPGVLLRTAEAALVYPAEQRTGKLFSWLPEVAQWAATWGGEAVEKALLEAAQKAKEPFPYARKLLMTQPRLALGDELEERVEI